MALTCQDFLRDYPEFGPVGSHPGLPCSAIERRLELSGEMLSGPAWGKWHELARSLWTAHFLAMEYDLGAACRELGKRSPQEVSIAGSMTAGTSSVSMTTAANALLTGNDPILADFARTVYGMQYLNLLYSVVPAGAVVYSADTSASRFQ